MYASTIHSSMPHRPAHPRPARRGIALLLVLILIAIGTLLTMRFLQAASNCMVLTQTLVDSRKAESRAESGIAEACYWLRHPELTGAAVWTGATGRRIDDALDYYDVTVALKSANPAVYLVKSDGHLVGPAGDVMVRTVAADFLMYYGFADAITTPHDLLVPAGVTVQGNVFAYNSLDNRSRIDGSVWVGITFADAGTITGLKHLNCLPRTIGAYPLNEPVIYIHDGAPCPAQAIMQGTATNQAWGPGPTNPMGVHVRHGNLRLSGATTIEGTLLVTGDLTLAAPGTLSITPKPDFPALVVKGNLVLEGDAIAATINGAVIVHKCIQASGTTSATRLTINGPLVFPTVGGGFDPAFPSEPKVFINHDPARANVTGLYPTQPHTLAGARPICYRADGSDGT